MTIDHLVTFRIIAEECRNSKIDLFCCFVDFRKAFNIVPRDKLWERLKEIMVPPELRIVVIYLHKTAITKLKTNEWWYKYIKCNIKVK